MPAPRQPSPTAPDHWVEGICEACEHVMLVKLYAGSDETGHGEQWLCDHCAAAMQPENVMAVFRRIFGKGQGDG